MKYWRDLHVWWQCAWGRGPAGIYLLQPAEEARVVGDTSCSSVCDTHPRHPAAQPEEASEDFPTGKEGGKHRCKPLTDACQGCFPVRLSLFCPDYLRYCVILCLIPSTCSSRRSSGFSTDHMSNHWDIVVSNHVDRRSGANGNTHFMVGRSAGSVHWRS
jgi:hypothetical protein